MSTKLRAVFSQAVWAGESYPENYTSKPFDHAICHPTRILGWTGAVDGTKDKYDLIAERINVNAGKARGSIPVYEIVIEGESAYYESMLITYVEEPVEATV